MHWLVRSVLMIAAFNPNALAQEAASLEPPERVTYFLIDASGSMKGDNATFAELEIQKILKPIQVTTPGALVSRTYFRAENRDLCSHPIKIGLPIPAAESARQFPASGDNDYTPLGTALASAIQHTGNGPADIFIVSDEVQSPDCGVDICEVARTLLPIDGISVTAIAIGEDAKYERRLKCIDDAEKHAKLPPAPSTGEPQETGVYWDTEGFWERWSWLFVFIAAVVPAIILGLRDGKRAKDVEEKSRNIQDLQRLLLTGEGDAEEHKSKIAEDSMFRAPDLRASLYVGLTILVAAAFGAGLLLFGEVEALWGINLDSARKLAWMVLSSNISNAFGVLAVTPVFFAFSQNWRLQQSRRTFALISGAAAQEEAKRQQHDIDNLYQELLATRASISDSVIESSWANPPKYRLKSIRAPLQYDDADRLRIEAVKRKLLILAQGDVPPKLGATKAQLTKSIEGLKRFAPRPIWRRNWTLDEFISDLNEQKRFGEAAPDWMKLCEAVQMRIPHATKLALKRLTDGATDT